MNLNTPMNSLGTIKSGKISPGSPIGSGLIGKKLNEVCIIKTPAGSFEYKILEISI